MEEGTTAYAKTVKRWPEHKTWHEDLPKSKQKTTQGNDEKAATCLGLLLQRAEHRTQNPGHPSEGLVREGTAEKSEGGAEEGKIYALLSKKAHEKKRTVNKNVSQTLRRKCSYLGGKVALRSGGLQIKMSNERHHNARSSARRRRKNTFLRRKNVDKGQQEDVAHIKGGSGSKRRMVPPGIAGEHVFPVTAIRGGTERGVDPGKHRVCALGREPGVVLFGIINEGDRL